MRETQHNNAENRIISRFLILHETLKTQTQHQVDFCVFLEAKHLYQQVGCARNRPRSQTVQLKPRSSLLMQVYTRRRYQLLIFGIWSWKSFILLQSDQRKPKIKHEETRRVTPHQTSTRNQTKDPTKHNNLELSDVDYVWSNKKSPLFGCGALLLCGQ